MSLKYMNDAWLMPLNGHEKITLLAIADCVNDEGEGWPGYKKLMEKTGLAKATLSKQLKILKGIGVISVVHHGSIGAGRKVNYYTISLRSELPISSTRELIEKIKELRKSLSRTISSTLIQRKVQPSYPISSTREHESFIEPSLKQPSVLKDTAGASPPTAKKKPSPAAVKKKKAPAKTTATWTAYSTAYRGRYKVDPIRNASVNGILSRFIDRVGNEEAPLIAAYFVTSNNNYYMKQGHSVKSLLGDAEKIRTEWITGKEINAKQSGQQKHEKNMQNLMQTVFGDDAINSTCERVQ